ncbi:hypothetical protein SC65A3_00807 [Psychrobacter sp. SC65A.3]|uniref:hypothetical protein n=1 Tax=Psychrobacter sp. SC65A.3 TaxID=2983299 RepID=UPI0021DAD316|nr:hypothetical protein [Psychrobacter sp. SC65A.3]WAI87353.1 hypothetical protein SC65A3_00807 [Psychrobacter sp. SC65A.3]
MKTTTIAKLKKDTILIFPSTVDLFLIYSHHIRPFIDTHTLTIEQNSKKSKHTLFVKNEKKLFLVNNFELYHIIKDPDTNQKTPKKQVEIINITEDQFDFKMMFDELIEIIAQHKNNLNVKIIHKHLIKILTKEMNKLFFNKNIFTIPNFCQLINITEPTYHKIRSTSIS